MTIGAALPTDVADRASLIARLGEFAHMGRAALQAAGYTVQSVRLSTQPLERWLIPDDNAPTIVAELGKQCAEAAIDYCSLGTIQAQASNEETRALQEAIPDLLLAAENVFASVQVGDKESGGVNLDAVRASAATIKSLSENTKDGFGNLRFAAAANCPPHVPFFPASYYEEDEQNKGAPEFGLALEAADLAVQAFGISRSHEEARENLLALLVEQGDRVAQVCGQMAAEHGYSFTGLDISMAPYPEPGRSIGRALEMVSGGPVGAPGTLAAATFFTGALKEARVGAHGRAPLPTIGYSGLMLPALEDQTLADRAAEGLVTLDTLLLLSAICGLGLDTVPLPGDISLTQLEKIILDMAALAIRLDKPLTARLLPVPGRVAGEPAEWPEFLYFAKGRVFKVAGDDGGDMGLFVGSWLGI